MTKAKKKKTNKTPCKYELKNGPSFQVVDGAFAGRIYKPGVEYGYDERPKGMCRRFKKIIRELSKNEKSTR